MDDKVDEDHALEDGLPSLIDGVRDHHSRNTFGLLTLDFLTSFNAKHGVAGFFDE